MTQALYLGIDVSKAILDLASTTRNLGQFDNSSKGRRRLIKALAGFDVEGVCIESTGCYSKAIATELSTAGYQVYLVQPGRVRSFAKSQGVLAKTDAIDGRMIARYAQASTNLRTYQIPPECEQKLRDLTDRRDQLTHDRTREKNRLEACQCSFICGDIRRSIKRLDKAIAKLDELILEVINNDEGLKAKAAVLMEQAGIGLQTAAILLAHLPELGLLNRQEIAALSGLAPYNADSGAKRGKRFIYGGRARVRCALHMASLSAARFCPVLSTFYRKLVSKGKLKMVAATAVARKLIIRLNTLMAEHLAVQSQTEGLASIH